MRLRAGGAVDSPVDRKANKLQGLANYELMNLSLLVGYNWAYSAAYTVQFLVAFSSLIFINIILDKKFYLDWQELQDFKVRKSSDPLSTVFSVKWQKQRQKAQELTGDKRVPSFLYSKQCTNTVPFMASLLAFKLDFVEVRRNSPAQQTKMHDLGYADNH